jgi:beta-lactamase superfamily II metal-dependent hydrolase
VEHEGEYMLVDGGDRDYASFVVSYLKEQNVEKLAYVISSHYDADHLNGVVGALNAFSCDLLLDADYTTDTRVYQSLCSVVKERSITEIHPDMGDVYTLGDAEFTIVCPDAYDYSDDNDNSIGIRLVHGDNSFLMLGDASSQMEWVMMMSGLTLQSDVYLASHHGSTYSTSDEFLAAVAPSCVVISAGYGNSYGHPTRRVLQAVKNSGASLYRTDLQGTVTVTSDGKDLTWNVEPTEDYRSGDELTKDTVSDKNTVSDGAAASDSSTGSDGNETSEEAVTANETDSTTEASYVLNTNTMKFHLPSCSSVNEIHEQNKAEFNGTREELISAGYAACKRCNP